MAQELEDGEFWLPSDFLTDADDLLTGIKTGPLKTKGSSDFSLGHGSSLGFNTDLSSPVYSVMGSAETESDEDEFIAGLTRKIANSFIQETNFFYGHKPEGWKLSSSPQSTLCACKQGSSRSSPNSLSRVSTPTGAKDPAGWDLAHAAALEVERIRIMEDTTPFYSTSNLFASAPVFGPEFYPTQVQIQAHLAYLQLQANRLKLMQHQQQMLNQRNQGLSMAAWPTLQQSQQPLHPGSRMRPVLLRETGVKKERTGTGVFLPRGFEPNPIETRKKPGSSLDIYSIDEQPQLRGKKKLIPKYGSVVLGPEATGDESVNPTRVRSD